MGKDRGLALRPSWGRFCVAGDAVAALLLRRVCHFPFAGGVVIAVEVVLPRARAPRLRCRTSPVSRAVGAGPPGAGSRSDVHWPALDRPSLSAAPAPPAPKEPSWQEFQASARTLSPGLVGAAVSCPGQRPRQALGLPLSRCVPAVS